MKRAKRIRRLYDPFWRSVVMLAHFDGLPLSDAGLDGLEIVDADGHASQITGLVATPGETIREAVERSLPPGSVVRQKP